MLFNDSAFTGGVAMGIIGKKMTVVFFHISIAVTSGGGHEINVAVQISTGMANASPTNIPSMAPF